MTRVIFLMLFSFTSVFGSAAVAITPEQSLEIWSLTHFDASNLTDAQAAAVINVLHGSDAVADGRATAKALIKYYQ
ncbi:hypothetical protein FIU97_07125 [Roseivivax sp. THAF40]|uniref:hypothetical protein n=1 Tax=unclassified Roseivivax TaxID=2639302 RepID=UPI00126956BA|nr:MULTISPECIES: hypothetical protein [unclassified Roseivivax]QFS82577.1 hypothetical protein FIV09_07025 [Roseivivax sp. THAF197b]QFT46346.1 hypothetical protein FIU97_07125 [Roseivivax sp. THAF40]